MTAPSKLINARQKLERADKHVRDLALALESFLKTDPYKVGAKFDPKHRAPYYYLTEVADTPFEIALIVGDAIHNLRSALDQVAMQLWIDGGSVGKVNAVSFPIFNSATKYASEGPGKIQGARPVAIKVIDAIEPYKGGSGEILWFLHELNNVDKHRLLIVVGASLGCVDNVSAANRMLKSLGCDERDLMTTFKYNPGGIRYPLKVGDVLFGNFPGTPLNEKVKFTFDVTLGEPQILQPEPILDTLHSAANLVEYIINQIDRLI
jgi:hypothetical protein